MLIKTNIPDVTSVFYASHTFKVVDSIAEVPEEVRNELVKYDHWTDVTEPVSEETLKALREEETATKEEKPKKSKSKAE